MVVEHVEIKGSSRSAPTPQNTPASNQAPIAGAKPPGVESIPEGQENGMSKEGPPCSNPVYQTRK